MQNIFKICIQRRVFEQSPFRRSSLEEVRKHSEISNVENIIDGNVNFIEYIKENDKCVGVKLTYDYGAGHGSQETLMVGETYEFKHDGIWVDDEGCPEDYSIYYSVSLIPYNEE